MDSADTTVDDRPIVVGSTAITLLTRTACPRTVRGGGHPFRALLAAADGARLLVVGHRGNVTGPGRRIGSTSLALVEFVPCPVVVTGHEAGVVPAPRLAQVTGATS